MCRANLGKNWRVCRHRCVDAVHDDEHIRCMLVIAGYSLGQSGTQRHLKADVQLAHAVPIDGVRHRGGTLLVPKCVESNLQLRGRLVRINPQVKQPQQHFGCRHSRLPPTRSENSRITTVQK
eukprot:scaffold23219_cov131-Isochrysis_galbana.AAC.4